MVVLAKTLLPFGIAGDAVRIDEQRGPREVTSIPSSLAEAYLQGHSLGVGMLI